MHIALCIASINTARIEVPFMWGSLRLAPIKASPQILIVAGLVMDVTSVATVVALFVVNCGGFVNDGAGTFTQVSANLDGCVCPGDQLTYECSSFGGVATVWHGSAFSNCSGQDNNEIILRHSRFNVLGTTSSATAALDCNGQSLVARSIGVINDTFTSQLTVNATIDTSNKTIQCDREDANGTKILVGTMSIQFTVLIRGA